MTCEFSRRFDESWPPRGARDVTVMLAVSGGPDSVALARLVSQRQLADRGRCIIAHYNHGWRGEAADRDEVFVRELAADLDWEIVVGSPQSDGLTPDERVAVVASSNSASSNSRASDPATSESEQVARDARYAFFRQAAQRCGARYLATGHTANDQAETILHRILRGTSVAGLAGIPRTRPLGQAVTVVRPLLPFYRDELLAYLRSCGQSYCWDATNHDPAFTRNRIRHRLLPHLANEYNHKVVESLLRLGRTATDAQEAIDWQVSQCHDRVVTHADPMSIELDVAAVVGWPRHLLRQLMVDVWQRQGWPLRDMGYEQWDALAMMSRADKTAARVFPGNVRVSRRGSKMCCVRR